MPLTDLIKAVFVEKPQLTILIEKQKNIYNFNRKYLYPGPSPPRRDDPMISGPLSSLPPDLESRLNAARQKTPVSSTSTSSGDNGHSPRPRPSDIMVAAVTARTNGAKTPATSQVTRRPHERNEVGLIVRDLRILCHMEGIYDLCASDRMYVINVLRQAENLKTVYVFPFHILVNFTFLQPPIHSQ